MRRILFFATLVGLAVSEPLLAQQRNPWGDLLSPREMYPQQQEAPPRPQRPDDVQSAPLPPPESGQQQGVPDIALPPQQRQEQPAQKGAPAARQPAEVPVERPPDVKIANPTAVFSGLDKITGRIFPFEVAVDETVQFGALQVTPRACYTRPPTEPQNTTGFVEVDEITIEGKMRRIFSGWMFASSPGLNAVEHAIYDVWLVDCKNGPPDTNKSAAKAKS